MAAADALVEVLAAGAREFTTNWAPDGEGGRTAPDGGAGRTTC
ncbi:hypothetical protein [Streptomyces sp. NPDC086777]